MPNEFQGIAFEVCNNPGMFGTAWQPWLVGVAFALIGSSVLVALIYMISTILKNPQFHAWAKFELYQIILTALISIGVVVTVSSICNVSPTLFADLPRYQGLTMFQAAENYLSWFRTSASIGFTYIFAVNNLLSRAIGVTWNMRPTGVGFSTQPWGGLAPLTSSLAILTNGILVAYMVTLTQNLILKYVNVAMLTYLLPIGILFRAFSPTRQFGGALIGLSIGMFVFFPAMLVFDDYVIRDLINASREQTADKVISQYRDQLDEDQLRGSGVTGSFESGTSEPEGNIIANYATNLFYSAVRLGTNLFIAGVILVALNFAVLITAVKELSRVFGDEVDVSSLTRMI